MDVVYDDSLNESEKYDKETEGSKRLCKVSTVNNLRRILPICPSRINQVLFGSSFVINGKFKVKKLVYLEE